MSGWEINLYSRKQNFHRFGTDDFALLEIGIGNYNLSSLANFFSVREDNLAEIKPMNPDVKEFFSYAGANAIINKLSGSDDSADMAIMDFNIFTKTYTEVVGLPAIKKLDPQVYKLDKFTEPFEGNIIDFLKRWDDIQVGKEKDPKIVAGYKAVAYRIQNSASGCITFQPNLRILGVLRKPLMRLYLLESADAESSRTISFNGSPLISDFPKTVTGLTHSFGNSASAGPGTFITANTSDNNPKDKVAGKMAMVYDSSTGEWHSGTQQILARLLTDIDPANVPELTIDQLEAMSRVDNYESGTDNQLWLGSHTTGTALPLSAEKGNPFLFGPDYKDGCNGDNKVKITVINRLNESYKAGSIVVVSKMAGENGNWVIISPGTKVSAKRKLSFGNFEYQQYIIPANKYFAIPNSTARFTPDRWISKIRDDYYINFKTYDTIDTNKHVTIDDDDKNLYRQLNILIKGYDGTVENPIEKLFDAYDDYDPLEVLAAQFNAKVDGINALQYITDNILQADDIVTYTPYPKEYEYAISYAKNITRRPITAILAEGRPTYTRWFPPDPVGALEVPIFWGMLFSDGYKSSQTAPFRSLCEANPILVNDQNLAELSVASTVCVPNMSSTLESLLFMRKWLDTDYQDFKTATNPDVIRKTGGNFRDLTSFTLSYVDLYNYVSLNSGYTNDMFNATEMRLLDNQYITRLEPLNPARLQFSSLSLEALYMWSVLGSDEFRYIKQLVDSVKDIHFSGEESGITGEFMDSLKEYAAKILYYNKTDPSIKGTFAHELGNRYNIAPLNFGTSLGIEGNVLTPTLTRHPAPRGSILIADHVLPSTYNFYRLSCMPVLTCKSKITTSASALQFTIKENIGLLKKSTVSPGSVGQITIVPIFPGIVLPAASNVEPSIRSTPQWGGEDDIDSFGTTALHVQIYEGFPINQVLYLGQIFTPLHFNPSVPDKVNTLKYSDNGSISIEETDAFSLSPVDFRVPTWKSTNPDVFGVKIPIGTSITFTSEGTKDIAPPNLWRINTVRRARLLSGGGFAYVKPVFAIESVNSIPKVGGAGYNVGEIFTYSDGSTLKVTGIDDEETKAITSVEFTSNINDKFFKKQTDTTQGFTAPTNASPTYGGEGGSGASFEILKFKLINLIGYDKPPAFTEITRLTSANNRGESDARIGTIQKTIDLPKSDRSEFDIFYFYHNDPSHYSLDESQPYNQGFAQHVISEISPV